MKFTRTVDVVDNQDGTADVTEEHGTEVTVLTDESYNIIKRVTTLVLPALGSLYFGLDAIWDLPAEDKVLGTLALLTTVLGTVLGVSSKRYNESGAGLDGDVLVTEDGGGVKGFLLSLDGDPELLADQETISFKVKRKVEDPQ